MGAENAYVLSASERFHRYFGLRDYQERILIFPSKIMRRKRHLHRWHGKTEKKNAEHRHTRINGKKRQGTALDALSMSLET